MSSESHCIRLFLFIQETVRAYAVSERYFVEVDLILPPKMKVECASSDITFCRSFFLDIFIFCCDREAHDIGEKLQTKLESVPEVPFRFHHHHLQFVSSCRRFFSLPPSTSFSFAQVERAFVHIDYDLSHKPTDEHYVPLGGNKRVHKTDSKRSFDTSGSTLGHNSSGDDMV